MATARELPQPTLDAGVDQVVAVVVPHTHWDREWYLPFERMRFHLVHFFDELIETLEAEPALPAFLLDGQSVILEDYVEVRGGQRNRLRALVGEGRLRPGPFYVQPDEFHVSGESIVRNLLVGIEVSREFGRVMREGYLPDTFGHVAQLPQILRGFDIGTFYAMRGFGADADRTGSQFWWEAPDGSCVLVEWLSESYSNAAVLTDDAARMSLHHGTLVRYDSLPELLDRLSARSPTGVLLLLNGGDHLRVQRDVPQLVRSLDAGVAADLRLGGLEDFHRLVRQRPLPETVIRGELRHGARHDVFDGIMSTRTPLKALADRTEAHLTGVAERLDALASLVDGRSSADFLRYAWRELLKNHAHDSICGCSVDEVHTEMAMRLAKVSQVTQAVTEDALTRLAAAAASADPADTIPVVVVNPSGFPRTGTVAADVVFDLSAPVGQRLFGWTQQSGPDASGYRLTNAKGAAVPFAITASQQVTVGDALNRRKELLRDRITFLASDLPPLGTAIYRLSATADEPVAPAATVSRTEHTLQNEALTVEIASDGTLTITSRATGRRWAGLAELLDDGDAGDEYGFGPVLGDQPLSSRNAAWTVRPGGDPYSLVAEAVLAVPGSLAPRRNRRAAEIVDLPLRLTVRLLPAADRVDVDATVANRASDHRLRLRFPTGTAARAALAESAFGVVSRNRELPAAHGWQEPPSGAFALRRFVALEDDSAGLQILTEGLHEYALPADGVVDVTLLRCVGWLARLDHPVRPHKVGPQLPTPAAQCHGEHTFRLALRPYLPDSGPGDLHAAAEAFSVPLQAWAVQGRPTPSSDHAGQAGPPRLGLTVGPREVVLSAVKAAEDGEGIVVRFFNSGARPVTAVLVPGFAVAAAARCTLEETGPQPLSVAADGSLSVPLGAHQIGTVRLHPLPSTAQEER